MVLARLAASGVNVPELDGIGSRSTERRRFMPPKSPYLLSRRHMLQALLATTALPLLSRFSGHSPDDIVEVGGWILKRSDLA